METDELQQTLDELCGDLLAERTTALDSRAILQSLAVLALTFPVAQRILGRSLAATHRHHHRSASAHKYDTAMATASRANAEVCITALAVLAKRFLYARETAYSAIALLAALARDNPRNQQRIVHSVAGVVVTRASPDELRATVFDAGKIKKKMKKSCDAAAPLRLYVLTIPDCVKSEFRKWRKRQRQLRDHRIPSGLPPAQGGVPRPCLCNDCLGREQFLPTWQLHFQDLARWRIDPDDQAESSGQSRPAGARGGGDDTGEQQSPAFSTSAFLQVFLEDFQVYEHHPVVQRGTELPTAAAETPLTKRSGGTVYYFVRADATAAVRTTMDATPVLPFDPLLHICALELSPDIVVEVPTLTHNETRADARDGICSAEPSEQAPADVDVDVDVDAAYAVVDSVLLFEGYADVARCRHRVKRSVDASCAAVAATCVSVALASGTRIARFLQQVSAAEGAECVARSSIDAALVEQARERDGGEDASEPTLLQIDCEVLASVLNFVHCSDAVSTSALTSALTGRPAESRVAPYKGEDEGVSDGEGCSDALVRAAVQITASVDSQALVVRCSSDEVEFDDSVTRAIFSATIPRERLVSLASDPSNALALLCISDDELQAIVARCRVCECSCALVSDDESDAAGAFFLHRLPLRPDDLIVWSNGDNDLGAVYESGDRARGSTGDDDRDEQQPSERASPAKNVAHSVPGLSRELAAALSKLDALVLAASGTSKAAFANKFTSTLATIIKSCNARISALASGATDSKSNSSSSGGVPEAHRRAGMERCRSCRDLLLQLGKRVRLALEPSSIPAKPSARANALTTDQLERVAALVRRAVAQVQTQSACVDAWETPDARVTRLELSCRAWASGFPDPEFYRESDARVLANRKAQRQLTRRLVDQQRARSHASASTSTSAQ